MVLADLSKQTCGNEYFEIIVVDDHSSDSTFQVASGFRRIRNMKVLKNAGTGKKFAIKTGIEASSGEFILTIDADCRVKENWLLTIMTFYQETRPQMIICPIRLKTGTGFFQRFQELEFLSLQGITAGSASIGDPLMCNGAGLAFSKAAYIRHEANLRFDLASGDDVFLVHSIKKENPDDIRWLESPGAPVITQLSPSLRSFVKQRARWISKTGYYNDISTKILAQVTFLTVLVQAALLLAGLFHSPLLWLFATWVIVKSVPDFLILHNTSSRYEQKSLLKWFLPSQIIYPFYVIVVSVCSLLSGHTSRF